MLHREELSDSTFKRTKLDQFQDESTLGTRGFFLACDEEPSAGVVSAAGRHVFTYKTCPKPETVHENSLAPRAASSFVFCMAEASSERVTGDEPQGTILPAFLCAHVKTSGYEAAPRVRWVTLCSNIGWFWASLKIFNSTRAVFRLSH